MTDTEDFKRFEQTGWVEVGDRYQDTFVALTSQATDRLLDAARVQSGTRMLDVACGPGLIAAAAARRGARVTGVDFSSTMVGEARRLHAGIEFREGDAEALPFGDAEFDAVVIGFGMLHFARPEQAAREAFRVLRSSGRISFSVWDAPDRAPAFGIVRGAIERHGRLDVGLPAGPDFFRFSDPAECRAVLAGAGFADAQVETTTLRWRVPESDTILDAFMTAGVRTRGLLKMQTAEALGAIRAAVRDAAAPYASGGAYEYPTPCVIASARKP
jgi:SAM-dependent methyltransferase